MSHPYSKHAEPTGDSFIPLNINHTPTIPTSSCGDRHVTIELPSGIKIHLNSLSNPKIIYGLISRYALKQIQELYRIEQIADARKLDARGRCELRQCLAAPILDSFEKWMEQIYDKVPPIGRMGQAITYTYPLWPRMRNYLKDGNLKIDNNLAENVIRPLILSERTSSFVVTMRLLRIQQSYAHY